MMRSFHLVSILPAVLILEQAALADPKISTPQDACGGFSLMAVRSKLVNGDQEVSLAWGANWQSNGTLEETDGGSDQLEINGTLHHIVPCQGHDEVANANGYSYELDVKGENYPKGTFSREAPPMTRTHGAHYDHFAASVSFGTNDGNDILTYTFVVVGQHSDKEKSPLSANLEEHEDATVGTALALLDAEDGAIMIAGAVAGAAIYRSTISIGPGGPLVLEIDPAAYIDAEGAGTVFSVDEAAPTWSLDSLLGGSGYFEAQTSLGILGGWLDADTIVDAPNASVGPLAFALHPAAPSPFRSSTALAFDLPAAGKTRLVVYDVAGRSVRTLLADELPGGRHVYRWFGRNDDGTLTAPGVYFVRLDSGPYRAVEKLIRLR